METIVKEWTCDVLVVGSGAAGVATALRAAHDGHSVIIAEKDRYLGGTTAISGGWLWVPGNDQGVREGDTREEAESYIRHLARDSYDAASVATFLDTVPEAMSFFTNDAGIEFHYPEKAPDYQMEAPGAKVSGRAVTVGATDARILGEDRLRMQPYLQSYTVFGYMPEVGPDIAQFLKANRDLKAFWHATRKLAATWLQTLLHRRAYLRTNGNALMTRMVAAAREAGIRMWTSTTVDELLREPDGSVSGARLTGAHSGNVHATLGVVIASGGFSGNADLRRRYFRHDPLGESHTTPTIGHDGDAVRLTASFGGHVDDRPHQPAAWGPLTVFRGLRGQKRWFPHLRAFGLPGLVAVDREGKRFANESSSYHDFGVEMLRNDANREGTYGWIISDNTAMRRYGIGWAKPWPFPQAAFRRAGYLYSAPSIEALAEKIGIPAKGLQDSLDEFNAGASRGEDFRFGRGSNWFHHFKGDMEHEPNPNLAAVEQAPFHAVKIEMGDLGTYAGLAVGTNNEVLDDESQPIAGLYAVGTAAVSVFGGGYPGYGANIGPAMVFGYRVGRDIARRVDNGIAVKAGSPLGTASS